MRNLNFIFLVVYDFSGEFESLIINSKKYKKESFLFIITVFLMISPFILKAVQ